MGTPTIGKRLAKRMGWILKEVGMNSIEPWIRRKGCILGILVLGTAAVLASARWAAPQAGAQLTIDQQKQLDRLKQLDEQLQKDRDAVHQAITQHGWDSDQVDAAHEQLSQDRTEYRKLRRSLQQAGVAVPPPTGFGPGGMGAGKGMGPGRGMRSGRGDCCGRGHHGCQECDCPCCRM